MIFNRALTGFIGLIFMLLIMHFGFTWPIVFGFILTVILIVLSIIDWRYRRLPDKLTLSLLWLGLLLNCFSFFVPLHQAVLGAAGGYLFMGLLTELFYFFTGKIGLGQGDWKLFAALGAWFGWPALPEILAVASFCGLIISFIMIAKGKWTKHKLIPFGPFLALSGWITLLRF